MPLGSSTSMRSTRQTCDSLNIRTAFSFIPSRCEADLRRRRRAVVERQPLPLTRPLWDLDGDEGLGQPVPDRLEQWACRTVLGPTRADGPAPASPWPNLPATIAGHNVYRLLAHRFPTSFSRYSAYFACGVHSMARVVRRLVFAPYLFGDGGLVRLGRTVGQAHHRGVGHHGHEGYVIGDAERTVHLHCPPGDVMQHGRHDHLDCSDLLAHLRSRGTCRSPTRCRAPSTGTAAAAHTSRRCSSDEARDALFLPVALENRLDDQVARIAGRRPFEAALASAISASMSCYVRSSEWTVFCAARGDRRPTSK